MDLAKAQNVGTKNACDFTLTKEENDKEANHILYEYMRDYISTEDNQNNRNKSRYTLRKIREQREASDRHGSVSLGIVTTFLEERRMLAHFINFKSVGFGKSGGFARIPSDVSYR